MEIVLAGLMKKTHRHLILILSLTQIICHQAYGFRFVTTADSQGPSEEDPDPGPAFDYIISLIDRLSPRPDFWIFGGDAYFSAADSADAMARWSSWKNRIEPLSDIPIYLAIGNHDANNYGHFYGPWYGDGAGPFRASWQFLPRNGPPGYEGTAYSFSYENSIFCVVNTNIYSAPNYQQTYKVDAGQRAWLASILDTTTALHRFVVGHVEAWPPSNSSSSSLQWNPADRDSFWQVMTSHQVEAYICGHIHLWNQDYFVSSGYGNVPPNTATRQVICGGAGGSLVSGYGGKFYHIVVWDINGPQVIARVIDSYGNLRDSLSYVTGVDGEPGLRPRPGSGSISYQNGWIKWQVDIDDGRLTIYDIAGRRLRTVSVSGSSVEEKSLGRLASGVYLLRLEVGWGKVIARGRITIIH